METKLLSQQSAWAMTIKKQRHTMVLYCSSEMQFHSGWTWTKIEERSCRIFQMNIIKINQRTSGPVNAHLTPGPGICFNAFIHVYSPRAGADYPLGTSVDVNRKPLSLCPFVASLKKKSDFWHIFNDFIYVWLAKADNPLGTNFWYQQKALIILPICCRFKKMLWCPILYTFFSCFTICI